MPPSNLLFVIVGVVISVSGCTSISYKPSVSLDMSPVTIKAKAQMTKFVDYSPTEDSDSKALGVSVAEPGTIEGNLAVGVTNAVLADFRDNRVFEAVEKQLDCPDMIIKGKILRFSGKGGINGLGWATLIVDLLWLFGLPMQSVDAEVQIEMTLSKPDGSEIGKYLGVSEYSESFSMYTNVALSTPTQTNKVLAQAIQKIRDQLVADAAKLSRR